jgi:glycopeptide antibiotics resistance protein
VPGDIATLRGLRATLDAGGFLVLVVVAVVAVLLVLRLLRSRGGRSGSFIASAIALLAVAVALAGIAELTLFGKAGLGAEQRLELDPLVGAWGWSGIAWRPVVDNVTLFIPLGASLAALWCRRGAATLLLVALLVSVGVEAFQWAFPTGRIANSADVIANTSGAAIGIALARLIRACPSGRPRSG